MTWLEIVLAILAVAGWGLFARAVYTISVLAGALTRVEELTRIAARHIEELKLKQDVDEL